jgi:hypothetical protein
MNGEVGHILDKAKLLAFAGLFAVVMAAAGSLALAGAFAFLLAVWIPWPAALAVTAVACLSLAAIALWVGAHPGRSRRESSEHEVAYEAALASITDVPLEVARKIITDRPIAALAVFSGFGVLIARRPELAMKLVEKLIARFTD